MRWATRASVHVDRAACAWLVRRFLDPDAVFVFVDDPDDVPADATAFDMPGVELSHHGSDCTFETFLRRFDLSDPVLWDVARICTRPTWPTIGSTRRRRRVWTYCAAVCRWWPTTRVSWTSLARCSTAATSG